MSTTDRTRKKVVLLGDGGVGKRALIDRLIHGKFPYDVCCGIGVDFETYQSTTCDITLQLWKSCCPAYFARDNLPRCLCRDADCIILAYDVSNRKSFEGISEYHTVAVSHAGAGTPPPFVVMGCKCDVDEAQRVVPSEEGAAFATSIHALLFMEVSAKADINVRECFEDVAVAIQSHSAQRLFGDARHPGCVRLPGAGERIPVARSHCSC